jgi:type I restriction enzyme S subunit
MKYRLGDICTITKGETGIMKAIPGPYTMIALGETDKTHIEYQFDAKAVIIPLVSSTGHGHASMKRVKYCEGKFALGNILCAVIPKDESFVLAKYLHIYLHWNREELLVSQMKGMANVSLPMNRIADVMVTVPSIDKQREIIELEKQLVEKEIETNKLFADQLTQLENLNQAILQEAVQGKLVPQDPNDESASELLKRIKEERQKSLPAGAKRRQEKPLPPIKPEEIPFDIPKNWVWCRLGEIISISSGDGLTSYQMDKSGNIPVYGGNGINGYHSKFNIDSKRIVIGRVGAYCGAVHITEQKGWVTDNAFIVYYSEENIDFNWLYYFLKALDLNKLSYKGNQPVISGARVYPLVVPLPSLSEQKRIVAQIERQLAKTKQLKEYIIANQQATEQLLKALLHQAFEVNEMETV